MSIALVGALLSGCGEAADEDERVLPDSMRARIDAVGPPQSQWLSDGRVSNAQLEAAFLAAIACIEERGLDVDAEFLGAGEILTSARGGSQQGVDQQLAAADVCFEENYGLTASVYAFLYGPTEAERLQARQVFVDCAHDLGLQGSTYDEVMEDYRTQAGLIGMAACRDAEAGYLRQVTIQRASAQETSSGG